ncbi:MAG: thioredoxin family protein [Pedobacter sp.]|nr:MAG: thioredoxin family protein [Pedobacter sp.]
MKKIILIGLFLPLLLSAQKDKGLHFQKDMSFEAVLASAKAQNKLVFIDVYTDWCGPCKMMNEEIFPLSSVGDFYNKSFVNYKINAEKGEGIAIARKYFVQSYPNYIFINGDGQLIHRVTGYQKEAAFLEAGKSALLESKQEITLLELEKQYPSKHKDKDFMFLYLERLTKIKAPNTQLLEEYISLLNETEKRSVKVTRLMANNATLLNNQIRLGPIFDLLQANEDVLNKLVDDKAIRSTSINFIKELAMESSLNLSIKEKDEVPLAKVVDLAPSFSEDNFDNKFTFQLEYNLRTKNYSKYVLDVQNYVNNYLLKIPTDSLLERDSKVYKEVRESYIQDMGNTPKLEEELFQYLHTQTIQVARNLNHFGEKLLTVGSNRNEFEQAKNWISEAMKIAETDLEYYKNVYPGFRKSYALALFKTGQKELAIASLKKLISEIPETTKHTKGQEYAVLLNDMQQNKKL